MKILDSGSFFFRPALGLHDQQENDMKKTLIVAAAAMLIGSSGLGFAGSTKGASSFAPGTQMNNSTSTTSRGASEFSPGDQKKDSSTTGLSKGASEFSPGDKMNDSKTGKK